MQIIQESPRYGVLLNQADPENGFDRFGNGSARFSSAAS